MISSSNRKFGQKPNGPPTPFWDGGDSAPLCHVYATDGSCQKRRPPKPVKMALPARLERATCGLGMRGEVSGHKGFGPARWGREMAWLALSERISRWSMRLNGPSMVAGRRSYGKCRLKYLTDSITLGHGFPRIRMGEVQLERTHEY
jgi:hypothetical protein